MHRKIYRMDHAYQAPVDTHVTHGLARYVLALTICPELSMRRRVV